MRLDPAGFPFVIGALALALIATAVATWTLAVPFLVLGSFFAFFFRDPERRADATAGDESVLSPADGRVLVAGPASARLAPPGTWQQISVFLSPLDVHVNRVPVSGRVVRVTYRRGRFLPAYRDAAAQDNERSEIWLDHRGQTIVVRQVVGILARRVVCRLEAGVDVRAGDRLGIMKFGSRMDVFVPAGSTVTARVGQEVRGGETVIAVLHSEGR